jgi:hypothetical protein
MNGCVCFFFFFLPLLIYVGAMLGHEPCRGDIIL